MLDPLGTCVVVRPRFRSVRVMCNSSSLVTARFYRWGHQMCSHVLPTMLAKDVLRCALHIVVPASDALRVLPCAHRLKKTLQDIEESHATTEETDITAPPVAQ